MSPFLSVIIPTYNEEKRIVQTLKNISQYLAAWSSRTGRSFEIIVVDDGSSDQTVSMVKACGGLNIRLARHGKNQGKGFAVKTGMLNAGGQVCLFTDADNSTPIQELDKFWPALGAGAPIVIGSRALKNSRVVISQSFYRRHLGRAANWLIQLLLLPGIKDTQCGFKIFTARAAQDLFSRQTINGWGFDFELLALAKRRGYRIAEVPVSWYNSKESRVNPFSGMFSTLAELLTIRFNIWRGKYD